MRKLLIAMTVGLLAAIGCSSKPETAAYCRSVQVLKDDAASGASKSGTTTPALKTAIDDMSKNAPEDIRQAINTVQAKSSSDADRKAASGQWSAYTKATCNIDLGF